MPDREGAAAHIAAWTARNIAAEDGEAFREMAEEELLALHDGSIARYQIRPGEFGAWPGCLESAPATLVTRPSRRWLLKCSRPPEART